MPDVSVFALQKRNKQIEATKIEIGQKSKYFDETPALPDETWSSLLDGSDQSISMQLRINSGFNRHKNCHIGNKWTTVVLDQHIRGSQLSVWKLIQWWNQKGGSPDYILMWMRCRVIDNRDMMLIIFSTNVHVEDNSQWNLFLEYRAYEIPIFTSCGSCRHLL